MTPEERRRAGAAIRARMAEVNLSTAQLAEAADVDQTTVRRLIRGEVWPRERTRQRVMAALGLPAGEMGRRAIKPRPLAEYSTAEIAHELCERVLRRSL